MATPITRHLQMLLAMPTVIRPVLLGACSTSYPRATARLLSSSCPRHGARASKVEPVPVFTIPEFRNAPIVSTSTPQMFLGGFSLPSAPGESLEEGLRELFTRNPAAFLKAESDFYKLEKNTRMPEVCLLGRSNVGKSSLINTVANRCNSKIAQTSNKAGKTRSINMYGFGPAPTMKELAGQAAKFKGQEDIPSHAFRLVDMPGYGHASRAEWGRNISLYLSKRKALKGAIVLIDALVGPKASDWHMLELLNSFELRTTIFLTKADKVRGGVAALTNVCQEIWDGIHTIETRHVDKKWPWDRDIFVSRAGGKDLGSSVLMARLAIARSAGLIQDNRPGANRSQGWSGDPVSFADLTYSSSQSTPKASRQLPKQTDRAAPTAQPVVRSPTRTDTTHSSFDQFEAAFTPAPQRPALPRPGSNEIQSFRAFQPSKYSESTARRIARPAARPTRSRPPNGAPPGKRRKEPHPGDKAKLKRKLERRLAREGGGSSPFAKAAQNNVPGASRHYSTTSRPIMSSTVRSVRPTYGHRGTRDCSLYSTVSASADVKIEEASIAVEGRKPGPKLTFYEMQQVLQEFKKTLVIPATPREAYRRRHLELLAKGGEYSNELVEEQEDERRRLQEEYPEEVAWAREVRRNRLEAISNQAHERTRRQLDEAAEAAAWDAAEEGRFSKGKAAKVTPAMTADDFNAAFSTAGDESQFHFNDFDGKSKRERRKEKKAKREAKLREEEERGAELDEFSKLFHDKRHAGGADKNSNEDDSSF